MGDDEMGPEWDTSSEEEEEPSESDEESFEEVERPTKKKPAKPAPEEDESSDEEEFEEVERPRPKKGAKAAPQKKADSSEEEESDSDEDFEEVERPSKKKPAPKKRVVHEIKRKAKTKAPPVPAEPEPIDENLQKEFLSYSNWRLLPGGSCHKSEVVASFRQHFPQYDTQDALPDEKIERVLDEWYNRKIRLEVGDDGVYKGFHLNPKFLEGEAKEKAEAMGKPKKEEAAGDGEAAGKKKKKKKKPVDGEEKPKKKKKPKSKEGDGDEEGGEVKKKKKKKKKPEA
ncbi:unnamed protein product [Cylindrotheca closterium]|uniref:Uncharacterized protein n=1 Tax=Cylindrotheca closterium TaxID=2856 RepID=A0AAD2JKY3_9STRA|nr:unnamed protein product [Cylindrotheca closterium]